MTQFHSEATMKKSDKYPYRPYSNALTKGDDSKEEGGMRLTWAQVQQVHRWAKNTNYTIAEMARKLDCPSVWVVWALEGK